MPRRKVTRRELRDLEDRRMKEWLWNNRSVTTTGMGLKLYTKAQTRLKSARAGWWLGLFSVIGIFIIGPLAWLLAVVGLALSLHARKMALTSYEYYRGRITAGIV